MLFIVIVVYNILLDSYWLEDMNNIYKMRWFMRSVKHRILSMLYSY